MAKGIVLSVCLLLLVGLLMKSRRACSGETEQRQESSGKERTVGLLLALSGLAAGFVFDWKSRQCMGPIMYCVMMLSTTDR